MEIIVQKENYVDQLRLLYKNYLTGNYKLAPYILKIKTNILDDNEEKHLSKSGFKENARNFDEMQQFGIKKMRSEIPEADKQSTAPMKRNNMEISSAISNKPIVLSDQVLKFSLINDSNTKGVKFNLREDVDMTETKESQNFDKTEGLISFRLSSIRSRTSM